MALLLISLMAHEFIFAKINSHGVSLERIMLRLSFIFNDICFFYPELVAKVTLQIRSFLEMTIPVELGWILLVVILVVVACAVALKKIKTSK